MAYWLIIGPPDNWEIGLEKGVWGLPPSYEKAWGRIQPGDTILCYATAPVKGIIGHADVIGTQRDTSPLWPQEVKEGRALWPLRIDLMSDVRLPRQRWEIGRLALERKGMVFQRALQRLEDGRARELLEMLGQASGA